MQAFIAALLGLALAAGAQSGGLTVAIPDEQGLPGVFETHSSQSLQPGLLVLGMANRTGQGLSMVRGHTLTGPSGDTRLDDAVTSSFRGFAAMGLGLGFDLSLALPYYFENLPGAKAKPDTWSLGDFSTTLKATLPWEIPYTSFSLFAMAAFPTSSEDGMLLPKELAYQPAGDRYPDRIAHPSGLGKSSAGFGAGVTLNLSAAGEGPEVAVHGNLSGDRVLADAPGNPLASLSVSLAAEAFLIHGLRLEAEFRHQRVASDFGDLGDAEGRATTVGAGLGWMTPIGVSVRAGGLLAPLAWNPYRSLSVSSDAGGERSLGYRLQPTLAGFLQLTWQGFPLSRDRDHDGIPDSRDRCPDDPEDKDGFQDEDGCPDPDNDGDGVPDGIDQCPYVAEDHDGFEDADGCPEPDNDHDGILDAADRCPNDPEDRDGFQDEDGCPDLDDDHDGIPDAVDKCPRQAENFNGIEDEDGCPEIDSDGDGIPDSRDKCPNEKEIINFYQDEDGCPDEKPEPIRDGVLPGIEFKADGAELAPASLPVLNDLAVRLQAYPGTEIEVQGYLDDRAGPEAKELSQARAEAVAEYLQTREIEARRMKPVGYGSAKPIAPNRTAQGRMANRRIEIHRLN